MGIPDQPNGRLVRDDYDKLDGRLRDLETTKKALVMIAAILGIPAAWGYWSIQKANAEVEQAKQRHIQMQYLVKQDQDRIAGIDAQIAKVQQEATQVKNQVLSTQTNGGQHQNIAAALSEPPFMAAADQFLRQPPSGQYDWDAYKGDLRNLSNLLLGYLGYLQSNNGRANRALSDSFLDKLRLAAEAVRHRASDNLPQDDVNRTWHTQTTLDNFIAIVNRLGDEQHRTADNSLPLSRISYYETDVPHWRDGVFGYPIG